MEKASFDELLLYCPKRFDQGRILQLLLPLTPNHIPGQFGPVRLA